MSKHHEAMKLALEALKRMKRFGNTGYRSHEQDPYRQVCEAITALEALAEQPAQPAQQAPVALAQEVIGCFHAAEIEGLTAALANTQDEHLKDLVKRRLMHALYAAQEVERNSK